MQRRDHALDPRIVGEDADRPEPALDRLDKGRRLLRTGDVGADRHRPAAGRFHEARRLVGRVLIDIDDRDRLARPRPSQRDGAANIAAAAGDQRHRTVCIEPGRHDLRKSQPPSSSGRQASAGGMVLTSL